MKSTEFIRKYINVISENQEMGSHKMTKIEAHYTDRGMGASKCKNCQHFMAPNRCQIVLGNISPEGWCTHFESGAISEKWGTPTKVSSAERGKYAGKSKSELLQSYNSLKAQGPHPKGSPEFGRMRELAFAIRAKSGWGKVE